jgi:hypothetical protein
MIFKSNFSSRCEEVVELVLTLHSFVAEGFGSCGTLTHFLRRFDKHHRNPRDSAVVKVNRVAGLWVGAEEMSPPPTFVFDAWFLE